MREQSWITAPPTFAAITVPGNSITTGSQKGNCRIGRGVAIDALEPIAEELERIGGSRAQLDLVEFTLLKAYVGAERLDDAHRMLSVRRRGSSSLRVAGLAAVH